MTRSSSQRSIVNSKSATAVLTAILATIVLSGCNRAFFREQADQDVAALIAEKAEDGYCVFGADLAQRQPRSAKCREGGEYFVSAHMCLPQIGDNSGLRLQR